MGRDIGRQICLCLFELSPEAVLEDLHFVRVEWNPFMQGTIANITNLDGVALAQLSLEAKVPRLDIGLLDVLVHSSYALIRAIECLGLLRDCCLIACVISLEQMCGDRVSPRVLSGSEGSCWL